MTNGDVMGEMELIILPVIVTLMVGTTQLCGRKDWVEDDHLANVQCEIINQIDIVDVITRSDFSRILTTYLP